MKKELLEKIFWELVYLLCLWIIPTFMLMVYLNRTDIEYATFGLISLLTAFQIKKKMNGIQQIAFYLILCFILFAFFGIR